MPATSLTVLQPEKIDAPADNELNRAESLADCLNSAVKVAHKFHAERISMRLDEAEELLQLLYDSIKTAKQIKGR